MTTELYPPGQVAPSEGAFLTGQSSSDLNLVNAIQWTLAYADVFDYPLTLEQLHRYLIGMEVNFPHLEAILSNGHMPALKVSKTSEFFTLPGRESIIRRREQRQRHSVQLWAKAASYGSLIARLREEPCKGVRRFCHRGVFAANRPFPHREGALQKWSRCTVVGSSH